MAELHTNSTAKADDRLLKVFVACFAASLLISLYLMGARFLGAISFAEPLQGMTRGVEYEMMFSIWQYAVGLPLYTNPNNIPFTASYYNWLHYAMYGEIARAVLALLSLDHAWLPTIARLTTFAGCVAGTWATYVAARDLLNIREPLLRWLALLFAAFLFFGPLLGFWAIATGPDIWPMVFLVIAIKQFGKWSPSHRVAAILVAALLGYAAWGFKQNFLYIPGTIGLFLLVRRDWVAAGAFTVLLVGAAALSLWFGGQNYVESLLFRGTDTELSWAVFLHNFSNFAVKFLPVLCILIASLSLIITSPDARRSVIDPIRARPVLMLPYLGVIVSLIESIPTSAIVNAAENHYFAPAVFLTLSTLQMVVHLYRGHGRIGPVVLAGAAIGSMLNVAAVGSVLMGLQGIISVRPFHEGLMEQKSCLAGVSDPVFVHNSYLALPWIVPSQQPFVVHFDYWRDIADGIKKERGGIHGLIGNGYFATIVLPQERAGSTLADLDLSRYRARLPVCRGMVIFERLSNNGSH